MPTLSIDFESRSTVNLKDTGVYPYARHHTTDIWCMAWVFDDDEPEIWTPTPCVLPDGKVCSDPSKTRGAVWLPLPARIVEHIEAGGEIRAWNAQFERVMWNEIMVKRYGAPSVALEQWVCTAAEAAAMSLPRGLDQCAQVTKVEQTKDVSGYALMLRMARPRAIRDDGSLVWWNVEDRLQLLYEYCKQDVRTERALAKVLHRLVPRERELYILDQRINDRGVGLDRALVLAARDVATIGVERANAALAELTSGSVTAVTNHADIKKWMTTQGVTVDSIAKAATAELLETDLPAAVRRALELRGEAGRSSTAKLESMLDVACEDDRLRGLLVYHVAGTGRWGGRLVQPHNFPRGEVADVENYIPLVMARDYDAIDLCEPPVVVILSMLRSMICAAPGSDLTAADFSAIECRVLNWLSGQVDVLDNFRAFDAGDKSKNPYKIMAVRMGRGKTVADIAKPSDDYQAGKAAELGCGFGMGWEKFITAAWQMYQVRVNEEQSKTAVSVYRETHAEVKQTWNDANAACLEAVASPGSVQTFGALGNLRFTCRGSYLYLILPSKRYLVYAAPKISDRKTPWGEMRPSVSVSGMDSYTHKWSRYALYGGLIMENAVQAVARDLMAESMLRVEAAGYPVILSVHDEIVSETATGYGSLDEYEALMRELPPWATGLPVAVESWRGFRYRK